ncbi:MAG TPA: SRPBCC domain-containing protein [Acidimicrobiales bacterium]|nr:SRPBCC domain-containing protein [Acidimicrobiales bacterium]
MTDTDTSVATTQVYRVWIRATPQAIWDAITTSEWTERYGYCTPVEYDLRPGGAFRNLANQGMKDLGAPDVVVDGEVVEADPPRRLVQTWRLLMDPGTAAEPFTRLTYDIAEAEGGVCRLTVTHELAGAPLHATLVAGTEDVGAEGGGGWAWVLSALKTLLETGEPLGG